MSFTICIFTQFFAICFDYVENKLNLINPLIGLDARLGL